MTFLMGSSLLITGLLAVSIPVIIHLLHRQKTKPMRWGAMMFLKESPLQMKRRKQVDHWLLLLLRMAVLAFLAWLLARPLFNYAKLGQGPSNASVDVAVVIDHSMSMGRRSGEHTLFEKAQDVLDQLTTTNPVLRSNDTISVVLAEHRPRKLTPLPVTLHDSNGMAQLHATIHDLKPGTTDCTIPEAIEAAREIVNHGPNIRKIVLVVSDQQKANWSIGDFAAWKRAIGEDSSNGLDRHVEIHRLPLTADESVSNISIEDPKISPTTVGINRPVQVTAKVSNSGPKDVASLNIHFSVNGREEGAAQNIPSLAAGQSITVRFDHTFTTPGSAWMKVSTDVVDALAADNEAVAAVYVWQKLPVLVIDGQLTSSGNFPKSALLNIAMQPIDPDQPLSSALIQPTIVGVADSAEQNLDNYYVVVLNDVPQLPTQLQDKLGAYVNSGHGLWVILGPRTTPNLLASLGSKVQQSGSVMFTADLKQPTPHEEKGAWASVDVKDPNNSLLHEITSSQRNGLDGAMGHKWWSLTPRDDANVVLASTTGDPLILERPMGSGRVVVWATSVGDADWNNWPGMPNFTPLVDETIFRLAAGQTSQHNGGNINAGEGISWIGPLTPAIKSVDVTNPDGSVAANHSAPIRNGHFEFTYNNSDLPGIYQLRFNPTEVPQPVFYGAGIYHSELDAARLSSDDQQWLQKGRFVAENNSEITADNLSYLVTGIEGPNGFLGRMIEFLLDYRTLASLVVLSLLAETFMTFRMSGLQKKIDVAGAGLVKAS